MASQKRAPERLVVTSETAGVRLDQFLARALPTLSRRTAKVALDIGCVFVNSKRVKTASRIVKDGDRIEANLSGAFERALADGTAEAEAPIQVVHEDYDLVVVCKPAGVLTAPTPESDRNNLQRALERRTEHGPRIFVVHRLDLQTSGLLVFAKSALANRALSEIFRKHDLVREYDAFVAGQFAHQELSVKVPIAERNAITHFVREQQFETWTWLRARLETGRTHQIRIHASGLGHPVLGDPQYGPQLPRSARAEAPPRMGLHARRLAFVHPVTGAHMDFAAPLPPDLQQWVEGQAPSPKLTQSGADS